MSIQHTNFGPLFQGVGNGFDIARDAGEPIANVPAYVRRMLEEIDPSAGWVASYGRKRMAEQARA